MSLATPITYEYVKFAYHHTLPESALPRILVGHVRSRRMLELIPNRLQLFPGKAAAGWEERLNFRIFDVLQLL